MRRCRISIGTWAFAWFSSVFQANVGATFRFFSNSLLNKSFNQYALQHSLIRLQLIRVSDNPDRNMENSAHSWVHTLKDTRDLGARGLSGCVRGSWRDWNHARKYRKTGFSWMKETLDFSLWQRKKLQHDFFFYLFSSKLGILLNFSFICFLRFFCLLGLSFASLIPPHRN
jgi:hypothetical protein